MLQSVKTIPDYKEKLSRELPSNTSLPDEQNAFYACFKASNTEPCMRAPAVQDDCVITLSVADVNKTFKQVNIHKAAGPDGSPGLVLRACSHQLASVYTDGFNLSLPDSVIPRLPVKHFRTPTNSRVFLYFYNFLHCRKIVKISKL